MIWTAPASLCDGTSSPTIVAGIGCRRGAPAAEIIALVAASLRGAGLQTGALLAIASLERKADEPGLLAAAAHFAVPLRIFSAAQLALAAVPGSVAIRALAGTHSVAEAAASHAGPLLMPKRKSAHATCALAVAGAGFDLAAFGQAVCADVPVATARMAVSRSLTSNAGP